MSITSKLSPRARWYAPTRISAIVGGLLAGVLFGLAWRAPSRALAVLFAVLAGVNLWHAVLSQLGREAQREAWRFGWGVGFAAAWHTLHVTGEGGTPALVVRAMVDPDGSPIPEPWDDWQADLHKPEE